MSEKNRRKARRKLVISYLVSVGYSVAELTPADDGLAHWIADVRNPRTHAAATVGVIVEKISKPRIIAVELMLQKIRGESTHDNSNG